MSKKSRISLAKSNPELAAQAVGWDPSIYQSVSLIRLWKCSKGHLFESRIYDRIRGRNCAVCAGKKVLTGFNDLQTTHKELARQAHGWDPTTISAGSHSKKDWICENGHITSSIVKNRALQGNDCKVCVNQEVYSGFNDLKTKYPLIAKSIINADPQTILPGSNKKYQWICEKGHTYIQSVQSRVRGRGCNICAGKVILEGFNDLKTTHPEIAAEAYGWDPAEIGPGSHVKRKFRCAENHFYTANVKDRAINKSGCPICSRTGFNPEKKGYIYFLAHEKWLMFQIGITNFPEDRIASHRQLGWELIEIRGPLAGDVAKKWESSILRMLRAKGADLSNSKIAGKFDGYSEAWSQNKFPVDSIKQLMELTEGYESN